MSELLELAKAALHSLQPPQRLVLVLLLLVAALIDGRTWRIPNRLTAGGAALGLLMSGFMPGTPDPGCLSALGGLLLGLGLMLPLYLTRVMGAGDVKLMAMAGAFLGLPQTLHATLFVFVAGGVLALGAVARRQGLAALAAHLWRRLRRGGSVAPQQRSLAVQPSVGKQPYAASICAGTVAYLVMHPPVAG